MKSADAFAGKRYELPVRHGVLERAEYYMQREMGKKENGGENRGIHIKEYCDSSKCVKYGSAAPYCMLGLLWAFDRATGDLYRDDFLPFPRSGLAQSAYNYAIKYGIKTDFKPRKYDFLTYQLSMGYKGHIECIERVGACGWVDTYAFNTVLTTGNTRNGDGNCKKRRNYLNRIGRLSVKGFVGFKEV